MNAHLPGLPYNNNLPLGRFVTAANLPLIRTPLGFDAPVNLGLSVSAASSALTINVTGADGNDPSVNNPVLIPFRSATGTTGAPAWRSLTAPAPLVISSGSTMGVTSSTAFRIWVVMFDDTSATPSTLRVGAINCLAPGANVVIYPLNEGSLVSSTAEGGAGASDSAGVFYTGSAVTSKAYRILGCLEWNASGLTAGTWTTTNLAMVELFGPGKKKPGDAVQEWHTAYGAYASGITTVPFDDTIPQNTEGDEFMTQAITPTCAANVLEIDVIGQFVNSAAAFIIASLFQDSTANALQTSNAFPGTATATCNLRLFHRMKAGTTSSTTFKTRCGGHIAGTTAINGQGGGQKFGGVSNSFMKVSEIMA